MCGWLNPTELLDRLVVNQNLSLGLLSVLLAGIYEPNPTRAAGDASS
jgi:hypothetical protein